MLKPGSIIAINKNNITYFQVVLSIKDNYMNVFNINLKTYSSRFQLYYNELEVKSNIVDLNGQIIKADYIYSISKSNEFIIVDKVPKEQFKFILQFYADICTGSIIYNNEVRCYCSSIQQPEDGAENNKPKDIKYIPHPVGSTDKRCRYDYDYIYFNQLSIEDIMKEYDIDYHTASKAFNMAKISNKKYLKVYPYIDQKSNTDKLIANFMSNKLTDEDIDSILECKDTEIALKYHVLYSSETDIRKTISKYRFLIANYNIGMAFNSKFNTYINEVKEFAFNHDGLWFKLCDNMKFIVTLNLERFIQYYNLDNYRMFASTLFNQIIYKFYTNGSKKILYSKFHTDEIYKECYSINESGKIIYDYDKIVEIACKYCIPAGYIYQHIRNI